MGMLNLYDWGLPNQAQHLARYKDNEPLYNMARGLWADLNSASMFFLAIAIVLAILLACYYYYVYNKKAGRKYKVSQWAIWLGITALVTVLLTLVFGNKMIASTLSDKVGFIFKISLINGLYASVIYFIVSFVFCNVSILPTNAYRFLKIGK